MYFSYIGLKLWDSLHVSGVARTLLFTGSQCVYGAFVSFLVVFGRKKDTDVAISVGYVCFELLTYLNLTS